MEHQDRYIEAQPNKGWGFAGLIVLLAIVTNLAVYWLHSSTYYHPRDLRFVGKGAPGQHAPAAEAGEGAAGAH
jgi:hypothetical protein